MLRVSREMPSGEFQETKGWGTWGTWIWSDLHLGHDNTIRHFGRPFTDTWQMDEVLFSTWERTVRPGDTIICLGDVAVGGLSGTRLARLRRAPGRKILVIGNHEINRIGCVDIEGFDEIHMTLYASGTPPLLLTHMPLYKVPEGCVNVHGHIHNEASTVVDGAHQCQRRAAPLPATAVEGDPRTRQAPGRGRLGARPNDGTAAYTHGLRESALRGCKIHHRRRRRMTCQLERRWGL